VARKWRWRPRERTGERGARLTGGGTHLAAKWFRKRVVSTRNVLAMTSSLLTGMAGPCKCSGTTSAAAAAILASREERGGSDTKFTAATAPTLPQFFL
jgi:hypothetical protein